MNTMKKPDSHTSLEMPRGLHLSASQDGVIHRILDNMMVKCPAEFILLAEISGPLISVHGEKGMTDLNALGALVAGDLAASQEIARITGQYQHAQLILREGPETTAFISEVGEQMVLYMRIRKEVPIGWARLIILKASRILLEVISAREEEVEKLDLDVSEDELNALIGDNLDSIWLS